MSKKEINPIGSVSRRDFFRKVSLGVGGGIFIGSFSLAADGKRRAMTASESSLIRISGRYPHLTMFSAEGEYECGIGALVPWANRLWAVTYGPYGPKSTTKHHELYEITPELRRIKRKESIGGTAPNRLIHRESNQLFIGRNVIDENRKVRAIPYEEMVGRLTATVRHLTQPESKIYYLTMEEGMYEVDVNTLAVRILLRDRIGPSGGYYGSSWWTGREHLPASIHGKGGYTAQGRVVHAGNGRSFYIAERASDLSMVSGCLASWDGKDEHWEIIETRQFTEVTGPGGIYGNASPDAPLWALGWDHRSLILKLLDQGEWYTYRLPKGDYSYEGLSGIDTEWCRIRQVGPEGQYLMDHHGMWFEFHGDFSHAVHRAPTPIAKHLKITPDFAQWQDQLVFGCFDTCVVLPASAPWKNFIGQAQSNLWFTKWGDLKTYGRPHGLGGPWLHDSVEAGRPSDPYAFKGVTNRQLHLSHHSNHPISFDLEIDREGRGHWERLITIDVPAFGYVWHAFPDNLNAEWIRLVPNREGRSVKAYFHYGVGGGAVAEPEMFRALAPADRKIARDVGLVRTRGEDRGTLQFAAWTIQDDQVTEAGYYEIGEDMKLRPVADPQAHKQLKEEAAIDGSEFTVDEASVVVKDVRGRPYRLPKGDPSFDQPTELGRPRILRADVYIKALFNACGILYSLPRPNAGGVAHIMPITTHNRWITDFCSWRGLLVLAGCQHDLDNGGEHFIRSEDGKVGLWFGDVDDLWKLGKPVGVGGPWKNTPVDAGSPSDPYLMTGFERKTLAMSHDANETVSFTVEVDFALEVDVLGGDYYNFSRWHRFETLAVRPGETKEFQFPDGFSAHWVRLIPDQSCRASALLTYR